MNNIPPEFQNLALSAELYDQSEKIGNKFNLHIDQIGELDAEIRDILMGSAKSEDFVKDLRERLEIDESKAKEITEEVNKEVFQAIKGLLQSQASPVNSSNTVNDTASFEQAGNLSVEKQERDDNRPEAPVPTDLENKDHILDSIENPEPGNEKISRKQEQTYTEPLMDHLLQNPSARPEKKSALFSTGLPNTTIQPAQSPATQTPQPQPTTPTPPSAPQRSGPDPYKEPIN
jgi:hypothetical protein